LRFLNGTVRHLKHENGNKLPISLPVEYTAHLQSKYQEILSAESQANANVERARQIEREYLFKACNGKSSINGLDNATYTKICTWRDQFKEPYAIASTKFQQQLESLKQQVATSKQQ